ncbi:hypothetical protein SK224_03440 [Microbacterium sp. BG28]|uniref:hypothetical protein n=1 Tax=Microbacterium sp. BG28 TaxID=3097356 RepID=UPI002A59DCDE|nr:hypothetical protein [Microbacterium sp. BG28]MDY0828173.1 hypothetical protein [Microbacterium sp. BG28]
MPTSRPLTRLLAALALGCGAALLASCAAAAPAPAEGDPDSSAAPVSEEPSSPQSTGGGGSFTVDGVLSRFPSCEAIGAVVAAQVAGLELAQETIEDGSVECYWKSPIGAEAVTFGVNVDPNNGADDVPTTDTIELAGLEYVPDAGLEAAGGRADLGRTVGDLRGLTTATTVPGVYVTFTQMKLGVDPDFGGPAAVAAAKQLLGIDG